MRDDHASRVVVLLAVAAVLAGCGERPAAAPVSRHAPVAERRCATGMVHPLGTGRVSWVGVATAGAVAYRHPGRGVVARFGKKNVNGYPTLFGLTGKTLTARCAPAWYRVQLPVKPNGTTGWVRASALELQTVRARVVVDLSQRRLTLYRSGRRAWSAAVAVGSPSTPTPTGRYYVNQRLVPYDRNGPYGPGAIGISAFSNVLTGWAQGGPVAIHGTDEPWSIGHPVSNGCIRLPNATLERLWPLAVAGTPVIIHG
jgi:lipoprotein-anchoring transpeptidase ErfK/SrfK